MVCCGSKTGGGGGGWEGREEEGEGRGGVIYFRSQCLQDVILDGTKSNWLIK